MNLIQVVTKRLDNFLEDVISPIEPETKIEKIRATIIYALVVIPGGCAIWAKTIIDGPIAKLWEEEENPKDDFTILGMENTNGKEQEKEAEGAEASPA